LSLKPPALRLQRSAPLLFGIVLGILGSMRLGDAMHNEFTAIIERDGAWYIAYCPEIPGANGQGRTKEECLQSLSDAIELILQDRREDALRGIPQDAMREVVTVG
jgi:predicted RNase H-like HicB family nuclease